MILPICKIPDLPKIYLASSSPTRKDLLNDSCIDFEVIKQTADEKSINWNTPLDELVISLAELKMAHSIIPQEQQIDNNTIYVLTADTLIENINGDFMGKPKNRSEAIDQIRISRASVKVATGFCIEQKIYKFGSWITNKKVAQAVVSKCKLVVPDDYIDYYLDNTYALNGCGAIIIDKIGQIFLKEITGSYSGILGLPMSEVFETLKSMQL